jgi:ribose transport system substrate-binding protein
MITAKQGFTREKRTFQWLCCLISCTLLLGVSVTGCGKKEPDAKGPDQKRIALVMKSLANEFFKTMEDGAKAHWKENTDTYVLDCNGIKNEQDVNRQIEIVNQMIAKQVDAIVIAPADSRALIPVCRKAMAKGIVVINIDNKFDSDVLAQEQVKIAFVGPNNRKGAKLAGDFLATMLKKGDQVAVLEGRPGAFNGIQRKQGFEDAMKEAGMTICTSQSAYWEQKNAFDVTTQIYNKFGSELKAILCANDSMALGAVQALKGKAVKVIGFDNISAIQALVKEGKVVCTVDQHADQIAVKGIEYALEVLKTGVTPLDRETAVDLVTASQP